MPKTRRLGLTGLAVLIWLGCSPDGETGPGPGPEPDGPGELPQLILSEPSAAAAAPAIGRSVRDPSTTYVSLPPGSLPGALSVVIRNVTSEAATIGPMPLVDGGFDPIPVPAIVGDTLELEVREMDGGLLRKRGVVPNRRPPVVVRVSPPEGRTDVALNVRPTVVFSEPVAGATLAAGLKLLAGEMAVEGVASLQEQVPWVAELVPAASLAASTAYGVAITTDVRDLTGDALAEPVTATFTTTAASTPPEPPPPPPPVTGSERIAFVSTRDGTESIYLANADGSGVIRLAAGRAPAWAPDGRRVAFQRSTGGSVDIIGIVGSDGADEVLLGPGFEPSWSPDGGRIAFWDYSGIWVMNSDGSGRSLVLPNDYQGCEMPGYSGCYVSDPAWSPEGGAIVFIQMAYTDCPGCSWPAEQFFLHVMDEDGSNNRRVDIDLPAGESFGFGWGRATWSPDGSRIALVGHYSNEALGQGRYAAASVSPAGSDFRVHYVAPEGWAAFAPVPAWSPDGRDVLFEMYEHGSGGIDLSAPTRIFVAGDGDALQFIPEVAAPASGDYRDFAPAWSPFPD